MVNGLMMLISFFLCRVMLFPILYWWYSSVLDMSLVATMVSIPAWVHLATLALWCPQLVWFSKMVKGSVKIFKDRQKRFKVSAAAQSDFVDMQHSSVESEDNLANAKTELLNSSHDVISNNSIDKSIIKKNV